MTFPENLKTFFHKAEKLKCVLRHSWTSSGRQESVAEHVWRMSLMAMILSPDLMEPIDALKALKMVIIHDLAEIEIGDVPVFSIANERSQHEANVMETLTQLLREDMGKEIQELLKEFNEGKTPEAKFAKALDRLEANLQHNEADASTWTQEDKDQVFKIDEVCSYDPLLNSMNESIKLQAKERLFPKIGCGVFVVKDGKVLLGKRKTKHGQGQWASPGGHLEHGEEPEECAKREVFEETGLRIKNIQKTVYTNHVFANSAKHYITLWMVSEYEDGEVQLLEPDKFECWDWFEWHRLPSPLFTEEELLKTNFNPFDYTQKDSRIGILAKSAPHLGSLLRLSDNP